MLSETCPRDIAELGRGPSRSLLLALSPGSGSLIEWLRDPDDEIELRSDEEPDHGRALSDLSGEVSLRHVTVLSRARSKEKLAVLEPVFRY